MQNICFVYERKHRTRTNVIPLTRWRKKQGQQPRGSKAGGMQRVKIQKIGFIEVQLLDGFLLW